MKISTQKGVGFGTSIKNVSIPVALTKRISFGIDYMNELFGGGGLVPTSVTFFTGMPGSGKTTLMLSVADSLSSKNAIVLFNSCEESVYQIKMHTDKLKLKHDILVGEESSVKKIIEGCNKIKSENPGKNFVLIVDSLQTIHDESGDAQNSAMAVKCLEQIVSWCKETVSSAIVIGQVKKDGTFMGNNTIPHMVDGCMHLSIEESKKSLMMGTRILQMTKHRFGKCNSQFYLKFGKNGFDIVGISGTHDDL